MKLNKAILINLLFILLSIYFIIKIFIPMYNLLHDEETKRNYSPDGYYQPL